MTDIIDQAQQHEEKEREASIAANGIQPEEPQMRKGLTIICKDCRYPIAFKRLEVKPNAARCSYCQSRFEKKEKK